MKKAVLYLRVSKDDNSQNPFNQREPLMKMADAFGLEVVGEYIDFASGGNSNRPEFKRMKEDAKKRKFDVVLVWSLDRFSREGIRQTASYLDYFKKYKIGIKSNQESWLDTTEEGVAELLTAILSWVAKQERLRISKRTKAGLKIARKKGSPIGKRGKDKKKRRKSGYYLRWAKENS